MDLKNIFKGKNTILLLLLLLLIIPSVLGSGSNPSGGNLIYFTPNVSGSGNDCNQFGFFNKYSSQSGLGGNALFIILILGLLLLLGQQTNNDEF